MTASQPGPDAAALLDRVRTGDFTAIARAITAVENRTAVGIELGLAVRDRRGHCRTLGVTGPPGAGKSSLINALTDELLPRYRRIGVLTVDPSSPVTGGAVLGDRVRMAAHTANPRVFIRSLAARGHLGGVTRTTRAVIDILAAGGMDLVVVETVGTGQSEVEVASLADLSVVVCAPGLGDEMQAIKAGVLEIADLLVVNKADLPDAARTAAHLTTMLRHRGHDERRRLLQVSTLRREGLAALVEAIDAAFDDRGLRDRRGPVTPEAPIAGLARAVAEIAAASVRGSSRPEIIAIAQRLADGSIAPGEAALAAIGLIAAEGRGPL